MSFPESLLVAGLTAIRVFVPYASGYDNNASDYTVYTADSLSFQPPANLGWDGPVGQPEPTIRVGEAFWYRAGNQPVQWVLQFSVNQSVQSSPQQLRWPQMQTLPAFLPQRNWRPRVSRDRP